MGISRNIPKEKWEMLANQFIESVIWGGQTLRDFAKENDVSTTTLCSFKKVVLLAKNDNIDELKKLLTCDGIVSTKMIASCFKALGKSINEDLDAYMKEYDQSIREQRGKQIEHARNIWNEMIGSKIKAEFADKAPIWARTMLMNQAKILEQNEELMSAVIPKYAGDICDAIAKLDTHLVQLIHKLS